MIKRILFVVAFAITGVAAYYVGWYRGLGYYAMTSYIAHGNIDLQAAQALRKNEIPEALKWVELDLNSCLVGLRGFQQSVPEQYKEQILKLIGRIEKYQKEFQR